MPHPNIVRALVYVGVLALSGTSAFAQSVPFPPDLRPDVATLRIRRSLATRRVRPVATASFLAAVGGLGTLVTGAVAGNDRGCAPTDSGSGCAASTAAFVSGAASVGLGLALAMLAAIL